MKDALPPGPKGWPLIGCLWALKKDPLGFYQGLRDYGPMAHFRLGPHSIVLVFEPEEIEYVLCKNPKLFRKSITYRDLNDVLGLGLVTSDGERWARLRRLTNPAFSRAQLEGYSAVIEAEIEAS